MGLWPSREEKVRELAGANAEIQDPPGPITARLDNAYQDRKSLIIKRYGLLYLFIIVTPLSREVIRDSTGLLSVVSIEHLLGSYPLGRVV